jgi:hypothetical protein
MIKYFELNENAAYFILDNNEYNEDTYFKHLYKIIDQANDKFQRYVDFLKKLESIPNDVEVEKSIYLSNLSALAKGMYFLHPEIKMDDDLVNTVFKKYTGKPVYEYDCF